VLLIIIASCCGRFLHFNSLKIHNNKDAKKKHLCLKYSLKPNANKETICFPLPSQNLLPPVAEYRIFRSIHNDSNLFSITTGQYFYCVSDHITSRHPCYVTWPLTASPMRHTPSPTCDRFARSRVRGLTASVRTNVAAGVTRM